MSENIHILLISHGDLCRGIINSAEMIYGKFDNVSSLSLFPGMGLEEFSVLIKSEIEKHSKTIVLIDLYAGTPYNALVKVASETKNINAITGLNLGMFLEALILRNDCEFENMAEILHERAKESIVNLETIIKAARDAYTSAVQSEE